MNQAIDLERYLEITGPNGLFYLQVFDNLPMGVMMIDINGLTVYLNQTQLDIDGLDGNKVVGRFIDDIYGPFTANSVLLYCLSIQKPVLNQWQVYDSSARQKIRALTHAFPLFRDGRLSGCLSILRSYKDEELRPEYNPPGLSLTEAQAKDTTFDHLIGRNAVFRRAIETARLAAASPMPILLHGETGVGKELFARGIHNASPRADRPLVPINCAAVPESLFEGIMFGVNRGAYTGAVDKAGLFEEADGGTIFLDELDSMPMSVQPKILRVLQENKIRRVGASREKVIDVKIISSVGREPSEAIKQNRLRADLFFRLGASQVAIPPLRERLDDIGLLVHFFINKHSHQLGKQIHRPSAELIDLFTSYHWPGNVRELEHVVTGAMVLAGRRRQTLGVDLLPEHFKNSFFRDQPEVSPVIPPKPAPDFSPRSAGDDTAPSPKNFLEEPILPPSKANLHLLNKDHERKMIEESLKQSYGNVSLAARFMGISPQTLHYKIKKHDIRPGLFKPELGNL